MDVNDDAVILEADLGLVGVDVAGSRDVAADVVAAFRSVEELGAEGALEGLGGDFDFDCAGCVRGCEKEGGGKYRSE